MCLHDKVFMEALFEGEQEAIANMVKELLRLEVDMFVMNRLHLVGQEN